MKGPLLSSYELHPALKLALDAATAQAREWKHDYLGVEHLLLGILQTENPDGPGLSSLARLGVTAEMVSEKLIPAASEPTDRRVPCAIPFTPRSLLVLDSAADMAREGKSSSVDAGHVFCAIMDERESLAAWALAEACADHLTAAPAALPAHHRDFVEWLLVAHGAAWEFPEDAEPGILTSLRGCGRLDPAPPDLMLVTQAFVLHRWFAAARLNATHQAGRIRLLVCPGAAGDLSWRPRHHKLAATISNRLARIPGAVRIERRSMLACLPTLATDFAGRLNRARFEGRMPSGNLRGWQPGDEAASLKLFQVLEREGQIPPGYLSRYLGCLRDEDGLTLLIEARGFTAGTASALVPAEMDPSSPAALNLVFGLVLPECQGRGVGLTLMAARLWLAVRLGRKYAYLEATPRSRPWLAKLGFRFYVRPEAEGTYFRGALLLDDDDGVFLETWLGPENTLLLSSLASKVKDAGLDQNSNGTHVPDAPR